MKKQKLLYQGAEAKIILKDNLIVKDRIAKSYRLKEIDDKIRKQRTRRETNLLEKASKIINVPLPLEKKENNKETKIIMPYIEGKKLSDYLDSLKDAKEICEKIGQAIAKLHDNNIIHGDLTTSNIILADKPKNKNTELNKTTKDKLLLANKKNIEQSEQTREGGRGDGGGVDKVNSPISDRLYFIDFGLGFHSERIEDKAVDLHLIKQAMEAKHFNHWENYWKAIEKGYKISKNYSKTLQQLTKVESRGRYKSH